MERNIRSYFDRHPEVEVFYFTSDGYAFFTENNANNHAYELDDDNVRIISRLDREDAELEELDAE